MHHSSCQMMRSPLRSHQKSEMKASVTPLCYGINKVDKTEGGYDDLLENRGQQGSPVVVLDPHEDIVHPLSAHRRRVGDKSCHGSQELLKLNRSQEANNLEDDIQTHSLSCFIP